MVRIELDEKLEAIADGENLRIVVFNLVTWAEQYSRVDNLIQGAYNHNPQNEQIRQLASDVATWWAGAQRATTSPAIDTPPVLTAIAQLGPTSIDVFLSYSRKDIDAMRNVRDCLREAELSVWTDEGLEPGTQSWKDAISEAVKQADAMVVLLSPHSLQSTWVKNEVGFAQICTKRVFPVLIAGEPADAVPIDLINAQWVDARRDLRQAITQELRPAILRHLHRPQMAPSPIEFNWVTIPAGEFLVGSDRSTDKQAYDDETPQHRLYLPEYGSPACRSL